MMKQMQTSRVEMPDTAPESSGRNPRGQGNGASSITARTGSSSHVAWLLMEAVVERGNMTAAYKRVVANQGAAGADGMSVDELKGYLHEHWVRIKEELLEGRYRAQPVKQVQIPKPEGGVRKLGIPTVVDRVIGQAVHQVLEPVFNPQFSGSSFGFRRGRSAHDAVQQARRYASEGRRWVVDVDLEKFFDRVNHDVLMSRLARKVKDKRVLKLVRRYLQAGIMTDGMEQARTEGTPQGSPLSPLLSNIMLDELDKELERRGHTFCRYADDCNIYVRSRRAGQRVMASVTMFLEGRLRLKVNTAKSAVARPWDRKFLGYSMSSERRPRLKVAPRSVARFKEKVRQTMHWARGRSIGKAIDTLTRQLRGWQQYFRLAEVKQVFELLDEWLRRRLRCLIWRQWKRPKTRVKRLMNRGIDRARAIQGAMNGRGAWWNAGASHMHQAYRKSDFDRIGLISLLDTQLGRGVRTQTAG
jgi:RNA-directed DNA polymerase